ncbi:MAG TPA: histidine kinase dimerization/phosphoacceptor domain -containing protein, partial [Pseudomonadales bacterium]|nr:histidine kinase dimerization/phosphoacceptor domain -containing protein [Pseudomonadales bacterium]
ISSNAVSAILVDSKGRVWLTTYGGGVDQYLGAGKFSHYPRKDNPKGAFSSLKAVDIAEAPDGRLWIATDGGGVVILDPATGDTQNLRSSPGDPASLSSDNIINVTDALGTMWVGSLDHGLNRLNPNSMQFTHYTKSNGLTSDAVYGMLADGNGNLWISSGKGLSVLNPRTNEIVTYDQTHGLQSEDFNNGAALKLADGSFLFGGSNGFNAFAPDHVKGNTYVPPIVVTEFSKFNEPFSLPKPVWRSNKIELNHDDFVIGFEFAAMDFTAPEKNRYQYMLEGFDRNWVDAKPGTHQVTYTNLDPGHYTFRVRGSNNDGVWNEAGTSIAVSVNPPIWATWWAYLVYLVLGVLIVYQLQKANGRRLRREAEKRYSERLQLYIESLEEATDCVLIADANKNLMYANNAIKSILSISPNEAVGQSMLSLLFSNPEDANLARQGLQHEGRWHGEVRTRNGASITTTEVTIAAVRDDSDNETAYVAITRDITDRKRTEAELENHRRNLEFLVAERTKALEREIAENKAVQRELANSLQEKELLLKEVHHRVKNNMQVISSLLNIQGETIDNAEFASLLGESQQRIKSMALIHENLYQSDNLLEIDFEDYIRMLANSLCRFYTINGVSVNLDIHVDDVGLDIETAVPVGLIINELISNSLKHAFNGRQGCGTISVSFRHVGCRYVLRISDDGVGLPEGFEPSSSTSMGMEIVSILTQQLDGCLHIEGRQGASFEISFPRKEKVNV